MNYPEAKELLKNPKNVRFSDLLRVAKNFFGDPRIKGSHHIFKVPWAGMPWVNLQEDGNMAKSYQVNQVLEALEKLEKKEAQKVAEEKKKIEPKEKQGKQYGKTKSKKNR